MIDSGECEYQCLIKLSNCGYCEIFFILFPLKCCLYYLQHLCCVENNFQATEGSLLPKFLSKIELNTLQRSIC